MTSTMTATGMDTSMLLTRSSEPAHQGRHHISNIQRQHSEYDPGMISTLEKYDAELRSLQAYLTRHPYADAEQNRQIS